MILQAVFLFLAFLIAYALSVSFNRCPSVFNMLLMGISVLFFDIAMVICWFCLPQAAFLFKAAWGFALGWIIFNVLLLILTGFASKHEAILQKLKLPTLALISSQLCAWLGILASFATIFVEGYRFVSSMLG